MQENNLEYGERGLAVQHLAQIQNHRRSSYLPLLILRFMAELLAAERRGHFYTKLCGTLKTPTTEG